MHWTSSFALFGFCCAVSQRDSLLRRIVDTQLLRLFGRCCYSIYLFHILLIATLRPYRARVFELAGLATAGAGVHFAAWSLLVGGICLALGLLSFYAFEKPFVMVGRRLVRSLEAREA
jgi:peptidoglycan/LPS O-acetylase OafA/YrhL